MFYALPNAYPYNELLLSGVLSAKTRSWKWRHTGFTLLYTSTRTERYAVQAHHLPMEHVTCVLDGFGYLLPVRPNTEAEIERLQQEFNNGQYPVIGPMYYRYEFTGLTRFPKPIPFKAKPGSVRVIVVPDGVIPAKILRRALESALQPQKR